ncbi:unnamed protein product [Prunus armeniaca]
MDVVFQENDIYFSVAQVEHCDPNTSQNSDFLFPDTFQTESNRSPVGRVRSPEEETYEILPTPETSSDLVPHQAPAEDVIQNNRGKPPIYYEADPNVKGKYPINNYISLNRLSESRAHFVKQLANISVPNSVTEVLKDPKWNGAMNEEMQAL